MTSELMLLSNIDWTNKWMDIFTMYTHFHCDEYIDANEFRFHSHMHLTQICSRLFEI